MPFASPQRSREPKPAELRNCCCSKSRVRPSFGRTLSLKGADLMVPQRAGVRVPLLKVLLRWFFHHLYHSLAGAYDLVASLVSLGRWFRWIELVIPFIHGPHVLELAHGTGHLQRQLAVRGFGVFGVDESWQMSARIMRRARRSGMAPPLLVRALPRDLPFAAQRFESVVATFPTEFIFRQRSLQEIHRLLKIEGRLIILPIAWIVGGSPLEKAAAWLFAFTRQVPASPEEWLRGSLEQPLRAAGFRVEVNRVCAMQSIALIVVATRVA